MDRTPDDPNKPSSSSGQDTTNGGESSKPPEVDEQVEATECEQALQRLGLTLPDLHEPIRIGEMNRDQASRHFPWWFRYMIAPAYTLKALRDILVPRGWAARVVGRLDAVVSPDRRRAIVLWTGDERTGNRAAFASNRYRKGEDTIDSFEVRQAEMVSILYPEEAAPDDGREELESSAKEIWVLLRYRVARTVCCELNHVRREDILDGRIGRVRYRIVLPPVELADVTVQPPEPVPPDLDVPVERKDKRDEPSASDSVDPSAGDSKK